MKARNIAIIAAILAASAVPTKREIVFEDHTFYVTNVRHLNDMVSFDIVGAGIGGGGHIGGMTVEANTPELKSLKNGDLVNEYRAKYVPFLKHFYKQLFGYELPFQLQIERINVINPNK